MKPLSPTQQRVFDLLKECGGNASEVARRMGVERGTIQVHIRKIKEKGHEPDTLPQGSNAYGPPTVLKEEGYKIVGKSELYGPDGETKLTWVRTAQDKEAQKRLFDAMVEGMKDSLPRAQPVKRLSKHVDEQLLNCFILTDFHLGMYGWAEECGGQNWDVQIAEQLLTDWIRAGVRAAPKAGTAILAQLGDFMHFDALEALTPANKNILDADTRFQLIVRVAIRSLRCVIVELLKKHQKVHIIMAEGNHDPASSAWLRELFSALYENEPRITVDDSPNPYYCYSHGDTSLFFHHGHKRKPVNVAEVFVAQFREVFGNTKHSYAHMGHMHHRQVECNMMMVEQHRTLAAQDAYAARGGWLADRDAKVITYHKDYGEVGRISITPQMLQE